MQEATRSDLYLGEISSLTNIPRVALKCADLLLEPAYAFRHNVQRNLSLAELPSRLAGWSSVVAHHENVARLRAGIPLHSDAHISSSREHEPELAKSFTEQYAQVWREFKESPNCNLQHIKDCGLSTIDILVASQVKYLDSGLESVLIGVTLGAWTAFEALVADIWEVAVNFGPKDWARAAVRKSRADAQTIPKEQGKSVSLSALDEFGFNLEQKMGSLLMREKKVDFQSLKSIKATYVSTFGSGADATFSIYPELGALEAVRNLFAHRGGKVDERFKKQTENHPIYSRAVIGSTLRLDGNITKGFFECAVNCGVDLIHLLDDLIAESRQEGSPEQERSVALIRKLKVHPGRGNWVRPNRFRALWGLARSLFMRY